MTTEELYKELGILTRDKGRWKESIPYVSSLLSHGSVKIRAKALWLLGEMGLEYPLYVQNAVPEIAAFCDSSEPALRERAVNALGRIGRGNFKIIEPYWANLFRFASDDEPKVRLSFIWASENIATNNPDIYGDHMAFFGELLYDKDDKVRMEAPEIFRVLGKRRPELVRPYLEQLKRISETDDNRVVRIHCLGAIKAAVSEQDNGEIGYTFNSDTEGQIMKTIYDFTVKDRQGNDVSLSDYQGKVLLIVNTATGCGFTPHYEPLESMYAEFRDKGFEILDFPCNQFANQAPGSDDEIHEFCTLKFGTEFPQFAKIDVNGETADPLFAYLGSEKPFQGFGKGLKNAALNKFAAANNKKYGDKTYIGWNFTKFLIDREGKVIARFEPTDDMDEVKTAVAAAL